MTTNREIKNEIQRIEGQLLVAKQICRENVKEIRQLKEQQEQNPQLQEANRLLSIKSLNTPEHAQQFNELLRSVYEQQRQQTEFKEGEEEKLRQSDQLLLGLSKNIAELESLFDHAKTVLTQPISSVDLLNNTMSLQELNANHHPEPRTTQERTMMMNDFQERIDAMHTKLISDECLVQ